MNTAWTVAVPDISDADGIAEVHNSTWEFAYAHLLPPTYWDEQSLRNRRANWRDQLAHGAAEGSLAERIRIGRDAAGRVIGIAAMRPAADVPPPPADAPALFRAAPAAASTAAPAPAEDHALGIDELRMLYVLPEAHGTGLAQALLASLLGDRPAFLWVAAENPRARAFYAKAGFTADGAEKIDPRFENLHEVRMVRR